MRLRLLDHPLSRMMTTSIADVAGDEVDAREVQHSLGSRPAINGSIFSANAPLELPSSRPEAVTTSTLPCGSSTILMMSPERAGQPARAIANTVRFRPP